MAILPDPCCEQYPHSLPSAASPIAGADHSRDALHGHLRARMQIAGPLTVADYMREILTNPLGVSQSER